MNYYIELNKEMVLEVQKLRTNLRLYCDEIVYLKAELLKKHENESNLREILYRLIVGNCLHLTEIVKPDADIIPALKESTTSLNNCTNQHDSSKRSINTQNGSKRISAELRRSNSVINTRNSLRSISPIRIGYIGNTTTECENQKQTVHAGEEQEADSMNNVTEEQNNTIDVIYEELDEENVNNERAVEETSKDDAFFDMNDESVVEVSVDVSFTQDALSDVTDLLSRTMELTCKNGEHKRSSGSNISERRQKTEQFLDKSSDSPNTGKTNARTTKRHLRNKKKKTDGPASDAEEETLQKPRRNTHSKERRMTNRSIPIATEYNTSAEEEKTNHSLKANTRNVLVTKKPLKNSQKNTDCSASDAEEESLQICIRNTRDKERRMKNSLIPIAPDYNTSVEDAAITSFINKATSSTPNSLRKPSSPSSDCEKEESTSSKRPTRQCKPKNLTEPRLGTKLRNETSKMLSFRAKKKVKK